jgi:hypothetical protein
VAAVALAACGGSDANAGGSPDCFLQPYPGLNNLCPSGPLGGGGPLPPFVTPSIQSFAVTPAIVAPGAPVTLAAVFTGLGYAWFQSNGRSVTMTSGMPVTVVAVGTGEQIVRLTVTGYVEEPAGVWTLQDATATATFTISPP